LILGDRLRAEARGHRSLPVTVVPPGSYLEHRRTGVRALVIMAMTTMAMTTSPVLGRRWHGGSTRNLHGVAVEDSTGRPKEPLWASVRHGTTWRRPRRRTRFVPALVDSRGWRCVCYRTARSPGSRRVRVASHRSVSGSRS